MLKLFSKDYTVEYGELDTVITAYVEEERNGLFELSLELLNTDSLFSSVKEGNIIVCNASDELLNQKFRIYLTKKLHNNRVAIYARHISFDLMYDYVDSVSFSNQSCEYALNQLFMKSNFSTHYTANSDIINAQDFSISMCNVLEAIAGKEGSILDTFGTGAEILRNNENISVLNKRGHDNSVTIEYRKNLTGLEIEEDTSDLVTRILPYANYKVENTETIVKGGYVDSANINLYAHPFIKQIDFSSDFEEEEVPTATRLEALAGEYFKNNKVDYPKINYKIEFIPLSKCVGYEGLEDKINLCDTVIIIDTRYNLNTQAKVIKTTFNVLKNRYEKMELGEPKTTLTDVLGSTEVVQGEKGDKGEPGVPGADGNIGDFPDSLPIQSILKATQVGLSGISLTWTYENKVYYSYELYASKIKDFTPNSFNLIFEGQASSYIFEAKPGETWHFKLHGKNSYGDRNEVSNQANITVSKESDFENYFDELAVRSLIADMFSVNYMTANTIKGIWIDAKQLTVSDGNGKRTFEIDSFGRVNLDVTTLKINARNVATEEYVDDGVDIATGYTDVQFKILDNNISSKVSSNDFETYKTQTATTIASKVSNSEMEQAIESSASETIFKFSQNGGNLIKNGCGKNGLEFWSKWNEPVIAVAESTSMPQGGKFYIRTNADNQGLRQQVLNLTIGKKYTLSCYVQVDSGECCIMAQTDNSYYSNTRTGSGFLEVTFTAKASVLDVYIGKNSRGTIGSYHYTAIMLQEGEVRTTWIPHSEEVYSGNTKIDSNGVTIQSGALKVINSNGNTTIDGSKQMLRIRTHGNGAIRFNDREQSATVVINHNLNYTPIFRGQFRMRNSNNTIETYENNMNILNWESGTVRLQGRMWATDTQLHISVWRDAAQASAGTWTLYYRYFIEEGVNL